MMFFTSVLMLESPMAIVRLRKAFSLSTKATNPGQLKLQRLAKYWTLTSIPSAPLLCKEQLRLISDKILRVIHGQSGR